MRIRPLLLVLAIAILLLPIRSVQAERAINVFYAGPAGQVRTALGLDHSITFVSDPRTSDVIILNGTIPNSVLLAGLLQQGKGIICILGSDTREQELETLLGSPVAITFNDTALSLAPVRNSNESVLNEITWTSAPQIRERIMLSGGGLAPLVTGYEDQSLVLGFRSIGVGSIFVLTAALDQANPQFQEWTYFNYLIYHLAHQVVNDPPMSFADYPASPVPHQTEQRFIMIILAAILVTSVLVFWLVRKYSLRHPEALNALVSNPAEYQQHEAGTDWENVGFHRPLGGFFMALFLGFILFVPIIIYQNLILPVYLLPSAQALGIWGRVTQFFNLIWLFFDMGTSVAFVKFFSQHRVHSPQEGVKFGQVFIWWQLLSGAVQVALMVLLASLVMPGTAYAIYAWSVIIHTAIQIPGYYQFFRYSFTGMQRFDYTQFLEMGIELVFPILMQPIFVTIMVAWGRNHPIFGQSLGGLYGMGIAGYAALVLAFVIGIFMHKRLGYAMKPFFLAHFDWKTVKESFQFGVFDMLGSAAWGIGQSVEILITQSRLVNYTEIWGNWMIAQNFIYAYNVLQTLFNNLMPSISEAITHGRRMLSQFYSAIAYQWGGMISFMLLAILLATGPKFILGASGPEFIRAAGYIVPLAIWGAVQYPSWVGDNVQRGSNRPWLISLLVSLEQTTRSVLALLLIERLQINALILAYLVGILAKDLAGYFINNKVCYRQRFYFWQSLVAPILAGACFYGILSLIGNVVWHGDQVTSILFFLIAILPAYPIYAFLYAFFGGWEDASLDEIHRAALLSNIMKPLALLFWASSRLGARISPLHGRFTIPIRAAALQEAISLTKERVSLIQEK